MIVPYLFATPNGRIVASGMVQEEVADLLTRPEGTELVLGQSAPPELYYYESNQLHQIPPQPSPNYRFDYDTKTWIDPRTLDDFKAEQWATIKKARDTAEFGGFVWDGSRFDSDPLSQSRIQGAAQLAANAGPGWTIDWTLADNTVRTLSASQITAVGVALGEHVNSCHETARALRQQIEQATTKEDVLAVVWPS